MTQRRKRPPYARQGEQLRTLREILGLSRSELASEVGWCDKTIARWERGEGKPRSVVLEFLNKRLAELQPRHSQRPWFRFIDLFAGIGGMRMGMERIGGKCVFTSEWDRHSVQTYQANFGREDIAGDIVGYPSEKIAPHDLLLAGFPCQPFSIAGVSKKNALGRPHGFACEAQGTLFFEVARILKECDTPAFLLENVKNLVGHDRGNTFRTIRSVLEEELGYHIDYRVIDASGYLPQHRERIFIVGFRKSRDFTFSTFTPKDPAGGPKLETILHPQHGDELESQFADSAGEALGKYTLTPALWKYLQDYAAKHRAKGNGFGYGLVGPSDTARTLSARYYKDGSEILIRTEGERPRRLTPRECARLMGFDTPERRFAIPVSDMQAYRQFGNSVAVPVVEAVGRHLAPYLAKEISSEREFPLSIAGAA